VLGIAGRDGAFADRLVLPDANLHPLPEALPDERAVFTEPVAAAWRITEQVGHPDRALVLGDGHMGLLVAAVLASGGADVAVRGRHRAHAGIATALGATWHPADGRETGDWPLVIEATGSSHGLSQALAAVQPCGTVVLKTTVAGAHDLDLAPLVIDEVTLIGSRCGPFAPAIDLLASGRLDPAPLVHRVFGLDDGERALGEAARPGVLKILLRP